MRYFDRHEFLVLPTTQVQPFDLTTEWVSAIGDVNLPSYLDWMASCCIISLFGLPAISLSCGFSADGQPVGLLIVGKPRAGLSVPRAAFAFEQVSPWHGKHPPL